MSIYSKIFDDSSSSDDDEITSEFAVFTEACEAAYNLSKPRVQRNRIERDHVGAHNCLVDAYFTDGMQYDERRFRTRFRMSRNLFTTIVREVSDAEVFFQDRFNALKEPSISSLMKCTSAIRQLAYGCVPDSLDEYLQMGETTTRDCLKFFCKAIMKVYGKEYMRKPTYTDMERCGKMHEAARKDVERAFGVLKKKWKIIKYPARGMTRSALSDIMYACLILHNMIIKDNSAAICAAFLPEEQHREDDPVRTHQESMQITQEIIDKHGHLHLKADLVEHLWNNRNI